MSGGGVSEPAMLLCLVVLLVVRVLALALVWLLTLRLRLALVRLLELRRRSASRPVGLSSSSRRPIAMLVLGALSAEC
jgi:hypothetical protein